ncbi:3-phosphoshikimate 1-carboxyvinyltransferase [Micrococcus luteus]|uniref:3-phosphoshikimate 1-carboxyvinyltransferase n=1 Tax=Micrococcus luteus TaxID=1270 RepID=UPI0036544087
MTRPTRAAAHSPAPRPDAAETWPAPVAHGPVRGEVRLPGSKSLTNRHLVLAALADGPCVLHGVLESRDTALMRTALTALGARFEALSDGGLRVHPMPLGEPLAGDVAVDCGLAGTVMRFVPFVAALRPSRVRFDGDAGARLRPMAPVLDALRQLGVAVVEEGEPGRLPFTMTTRADAATVAPDGDVPEVAVDASGSSQFLSAALLAAAGMPRGLRLRHTGQTVPSPEHVAMTVGVLRALEVDVAETGPGAWTVAPGRIPAHEATVEPDLSNAGPFLAAAVATGGSVTVPDWPTRTTQIGDRWRRILPQFGASVALTVDRTDRSRGRLTVTGAVHDDGAPRITGAGEIADTAELAPIAAALALLASGPTRLTGIGHLRGHETDRLAALTAEAARLGITVDEDETSLGFPGTDASGPLSPAALETYHDHRMATFAAVVGLRVPGTGIVDVATTAKTMPDFPALWTALVAPGDAAEEAR